jgi:hypothetical protein
MNFRRFVLRLAVGLLCFSVGWASAVLLGATRRARTYAPRHVRTELIVVPHFEPPAGPSCRERMRPRHAHEWHDMRRLEEFEMRFEIPPPPPPRPRRVHR